MVITDNDTPSPSRPFVTMNIAESADGKIAPIGHGKVNFGSVEDRAQMERLRAEADGVLIGGGTLVAEDPPLLIRDPDLSARRLAAKGAPHPRNITVCSMLPAHVSTMRFFLNQDTEKFVFTTEKTPADRLAVASQFAQVEVVPLTSAGRVDLKEVLCRLLQMGVRRLLLEGGGELNFSMLDAGLVDEVHLTICPFLFGGRTAPTPVDGVGFPRDRVRKLALKNHRVGTQGEIFLHYDVLPGTPTISQSKLFPNGFEVR